MGSAYCSGVSLALALALFLPGSVWRGTFLPCGHPHSSIKTDLGSPALRSLLAASYSNRVGWGLPPAWPMYVPKGPSGDRGPLFIVYPQEVTLNSGNFRPSDQKWCPATSTGRLLGVADS